MKTYSLFFALLFIASIATGQGFTSYEKPMEFSMFSEALNDSVNLEITLPKELGRQANKEYPIIYLLDKQLESNYRYNLHTIDYLSSLQWMPQAIIVGITFSWKNRGAWTNPNETGGKADDLIRFIEHELQMELRQKYPVSNFNLLVGHSRTAIFSSYALSQSPEFFNGVIANSVANFDFGDDWQQKQFDIFLKKIPNIPHKFYYYFSVGERAYGDLHEAAVDTLAAYLNTTALPANFEWEYYKHQVAHDVTPGVTVGKAFSEIFKDYGKRIDACFDIAKRSSTEVPWNDFLAVYSAISTDLGIEVEPAELFYNSIASAYYNDYDGIYGDKRLNFTLEILLHALENYPNDFGYYSWIGEIYLTLGEDAVGEKYLNRALELLNKDTSLSAADRTAYLEEIEAIKSTNK